MRHKRVYTTKLAMLFNVTLVYSYIVIGIEMEQTGEHRQVCRSLSIRHWCGIYTPYSFMSYKNLFEGAWSFEVQQSTEICESSQGF